METKLPPNIQKSHQYLLFIYLNGGYASTPQIHEQFKDDRSYTWCTLRKLALGKMLSISKEEDHKKQGPPANVFTITKQGVKKLNYLIEKWKKERNITIELPDIGIE